MAGPLRVQFMVQTENPLLEVEEDERRVRVRHGGNDYLFPRDDVVLLPIKNTTAELIAEYLAGRLVEEIGPKSRAHLVDLAVEVEESPGQSATFRRSL